MGRELRRVPLDFKYPTGMIWKGFINPYGSQECKCCDGSGLNEATNKLNEDWYSFDNPKYITIDEKTGRRYNDNAWSHHLTDVEVDALMKAGRLSDVSCFRGHLDEDTNKWMVFKDGNKIEVEKPEYPSAEKVNQWSIESNFGHDAINRWICVKARAKHLGVYGLCEICEGEGKIYQTEEIKELHEKWESIDPPKGEGFQLWDTTSEGCPMTPVFTTLDLLCDYLVEHNITTFGYSTATKDKWMQMLGDDLVFHEEGGNIFI